MAQPYDPRNMGQPRSLPKKVNNKKGNILTKTVDFVSRHILLLILVALVVWYLCCMNKDSAVSGVVSTNSVAPIGTFPETPDGLRAFLN